MNENELLFEINEHVQGLDEDDFYTSNIYFVSNTIVYTSLYEPTHHLITLIFELDEKKEKVIDVYGDFELFDLEYLVNEYLNTQPLNTLEKAVSYRENQG